MTMKLFKVTKKIEVFLEADNSDDSIDAFASYDFDDDAEVDTEEILSKTEYAGFCVENAEEMAVEEWFDKQVFEEKDSKLDIANDKISDLESDVVTRDKDIAFMEKKIADLQRENEALEDENSALRIDEV